MIRLLEQLEKFIISRQTPEKKVELIQDGYTEWDLFPDRAAWGRGVADRTGLSPEDFREYLGKLLTRCGFTTIEQESISHELSCHRDFNGLAAPATGDGVFVTAFVGKKPLCFQVRVFPFDPKRAEQPFHRTLPEAILQPHLSYVNDSADQLMSKWRLLYSPAAGWLMLLSPPNRGGSSAALAGVSLLHVVTMLPIFIGITAYGSVELSATYVGAFLCGCWVARNAVLDNRFLKEMRWRISRGSLAVALLIPDEEADTRAAEGSSAGAAFAFNIVLARWHELKPRFKGSPACAFLYWVHDNASKFAVMGKVSGTWLWPTRNKEKEDAAKALGKGLLGLVKTKLLNVFLDIGLSGSSRRRNALLGSVLSVLCLASPIPTAFLQAFPADFELDRKTELHEDSLYLSGICGGIGSRVVTIQSSRFLPLPEPVAIPADKCFTVLPLTPRPGSDPSLADDAYVIVTTSGFLPLWSRNPKPARSFRYPLAGLKKRRTK